MAWISFADSRGQGYEVNLPMVAQTFASRANAQSRFERTNFVPLSDGRHLAYNHNGARAEIHSRVQRDLAEFEELRFQDGMAAFRSVVVARAQAVRAQQRLVQRVQRASHAISQDVQQRIDRAITALSVTSTVLITTSVMIPNPIGAGVALGMGSVLAGTSTYGETNHLGAAVLSGTTSLIAGLIPFGAGAAGIAEQTAIHAGTRAMTTGESAAIFFVGAQLEIGSNAAVSITSGERGDRALVNALATTAFSTVAGEAVSSARSALGNRHIPVALRSTVNTLNDVAAPHATSAAASAAATGTTNLLMGAAPGVGSSSPTTVSGQPTANLLNGRRRPSCETQFQENYVVLFAMRPVLGEVEMVDGWWRSLGEIHCD